MVLLTNLQMQAPYTGTSTRHKGKSFRQAFIDEMQILSNSAAFNAASTKQKASALFSAKSTEKWDIAIILAATASDVDSDDNTVLRAVINKLPQVVQAYYNITGQKLNAVVCKSSWQKASQYPSANGAKSPTLVAKLRAYNASIQKIVNKIGIQYPGQDNSIMQQWYSVVTPTPTCSATEIDNILIELITSQATPSKLQTTNLPNLDNIPQILKILTHYLNFQTTVIKLQTQPPIYTLFGHLALIVLILNSSTYPHL